MQFHSRRLALLAIAAVAVALIGASVAGARSSKTFGDGTHRVGKNDVPAGTYRAPGGDGCYWERLKNFSGGISGILANDNASGPTVVTIKATDRGFNSESCGTWTSSLKRVTKSMTKFSDGQYIVKTDIAPGTYQSKGGDGCYWEREKAFSGGIDSILANANPVGHTIVTIKSTDRGFKSNDCGTWSRF